MHVAIFPLHTVLFPGGILPLKVFEQRYMDMSAECLRTNNPFGICLIRQGNEAGDPAEPADVGCLARITDWDMQQLGLLRINVRGTGRFRIRSQSVGRSGLITAEAEEIPAEPATALPAAHKSCALVLEKIVERIGAERFAAPFRYDDATWVSYRLAEILPLPFPAKQKLLELNGSAARLEVLHGFLIKQGLTS